MKNPGSAQPLKSEISKAESDAMATFDKKTVYIRFAYKENNGFSIADYNNPDEKKARNLQVISK